MNYFIDTEFLEGTQERPLILKGRLGNLMIGYPKPTIDLISIGIVAEDGREYYAISKDFNLKEAWNRYDVIKGDSTMVNSIGDTQYEVKNYWIRENVLKPIWRELYFKADDCYGLSNSQTAFLYKGIQEGKHDDLFTYDSLKRLINHYGKTNKQIAEEIKQFCIQMTKEEEPFLKTKDYGDLYEVKIDKPKFYGYFADYDWVVFCWLFGKMIDLPNGFPYYCIDLKQMLDEAQHLGSVKNLSIDLDLKNHPDYPKQENEHNALADAQWNKKLYEFLTKI